MLKVYCIAVVIVWVLLYIRDANSYCILNQSPYDVKVIMYPLKTKHTMKKMSSKCFIGTIKEYVPMIELYKSTYFCSDVLLKDGKLVIKANSYNTIINCSNR